MYSDNTIYAIVIQKAWRKYYNLKKIEEKKDNCRRKGIDPMSKCPFTLLYIYELSDVTQLIMNLNGVNNVCELVSYLKWINEFDFLTAPRHFWGSNMTKLEFENIIVFGDKYYCHLCEQSSKLVKIDNYKHKTISNHQSTQTINIERIESEAKSLKYLLNMIKNTNYYRKYPHKKCEILKEEYKQMINDLQKIYDNHPCIGEQSLNRKITLMDSYTLNQYYKKEFLEMVEFKIYDVEKFRIDMDNTYIKAGILQSTNNPIKKGIEDENDSPSPSAPPLYY
jgi:hypothetical protein